MTLVSTYQLASKSVCEILCKKQCHRDKTPRLKYVLPIPPRVAFKNDKSLKDKLVSSKLQNSKRRAPR